MNQVLHGFKYVMLFLVRLNLHYLLLTEIINNHLYFLLFCFRFLFLFKGVQDLLNFYELFFNFIAGLVYLLASSFFKFSLSCRIFYFSYDFSKAAYILPSNYFFNYFYRSRILVFAKSLIFLFLQIDPLLSNPNSNFLFAYSEKACILSLLLENI